MSLVTSKLIASNTDVIFRLTCAKFCAWTRTACQQSLLMSSQLRPCPCPPKRSQYDVQGSSCQFPPESKIYIRSRHGTTFRPNWECDAPKGQITYPKRCIFAKKSAAKGVFSFQDPWPGVYFFYENHRKIFISFIKSYFTEGIFFFQII